MLEALGVGGAPGLESRAVFLPQATVLPSTVPRQVRSRGQSGVQLRPEKQVRAPPCHPSLSPIYSRL